MRKAERGIVQGLRRSANLSRPHHPNDPIAKIVILKQDEHGEQQRKAGRCQRRNGKLEILQDSQERTGRFVLNLDLDRFSALGRFLYFSLHVPKELTRGAPKSCAVEIVCDLADLDAQISLIFGKFRAKR